MTKPRNFEKPTGFRDLSTPLTEKKRMIEERVQEKMERWGYQQVLTPTLEFYDTVGNASAIPESKLFKCMDRAGNPLVLRPDQTAPIARFVTSVLKQEPLPLRLYYHASVFRAPESETGRSAEFYQSGVELVGDRSPEADAEVIALALESLKACEIEPFQMAIGHVAILHGILEERIADPTKRKQLQIYLGERNVVGFAQEIQELSLLESSKKEILSLLTHQSRESLNRIASQTGSDSVREAVRHLIQVWEFLEEDGWAANVKFDLSLMGSFDYYTGIYFEGYAAGTGFPLASGGRYDQLIAKFGRSLPATGFALKINQLMEVSPAEVSRRERIRIQYPQDLRREAMQMAILLRDQGKAVVMEASSEVRAITQIKEGSESR